MACATIHELQAHVVIPCHGQRHVSQPAQIASEFQKRLATGLSPQFYREVLGDDARGLVLRGLIEKVPSWRYFMAYRWFSLGEDSPYFMRDLRRHVLRFRGKSFFSPIPYVHVVVAGHTNELECAKKQFRPDRLAGGAVVVYRVQVVDPALGISTHKDAWWTKLDPPSDVPEAIAQIARECSRATRNQ